MNHVVTLDVDGARLSGVLRVPPRARGLVLFAHGSGSNHHSPRNQFVANWFHGQAGLGTLLVDLLSAREQADPSFEPDLGRLADRLLAIAEWLLTQRPTRVFPLGLFGASSGGGAAVLAAAERPDLIRAVVSRGGRPDLVPATSLSRLRVPTLFLVGERDQAVLSLHGTALREVPPAVAELRIVKGAGHLFEEPGALEQVSREAASWLTDHLSRPAPVTVEPIVFRDRRDAGVRLGAHLRDRRDLQGAWVLGLPRGGIPVAFEVARALRGQLDVYVVRKLGLPGQEELAIGAIATGGVRILNDDMVKHFGVTAEELASITAREAAELARRQTAFRAGRPVPQVSGQTVILVDDGLATGSTMAAAVQGLRTARPARIVVAVPVAANDTCERMRSIADEVVCLTMPEPLYAVGRWYADFTQTTDDEVRELLRRAPSDAPREPLPS